MRDNRNMQQSTSVVLSVSEADLLRRLAGVMGIFRLAEKLGVSRPSVERAAARLTIRRGTAALIRAALNLSAQERESSPTGKDGEPRDNDRHEHCAYEFKNQGGGGSAAAKFACSPPDPAGAHLHR